MKKTLKIIGILFLISILLRGFLFRLCVNYTAIGNRTEIPVTHPKLIKAIETIANNQSINFRTIPQIASNITTENLDFISQSTSRNSNQVFKTRQANCIGYSALFHSVTQYLIKKYQLEQEIDSKHLIGKLDFLGLDLHQFFQSPFFKDHDFNQIKNLKTGESIYIDPSLRDYLGIKTVSCKN